MNVKNLLVTLIFASLLPLSLRAAQEEASPPPPPGQDEFPEPESWKDRVRREGAVRELSLKDAIRLALINNLEIAIEEYNEDLNQQNIIGTKGFYDPTLSFRFDWESSESPARSFLDVGAGIPVTTSKGLRFNTSYGQNVPGGGQFAVGFDNFRGSANSSFLLANPYFNSNFGVNFTQPLWRGFLQTQTERQLKLSNLDTEITESQFRQTVADVVQQVQDQYWELVYAIENQEILRQSMELAIVLHRNNKRRVEIGVEAPIEITSSRADVANREQQMIGAEVDIIRAQNALKGILAPDPKAGIWNLTLIPTGKPQMKELIVTLEGAIEKALERRPELEQVRLEMEQKEVDRAYFKKEGKPSVNLVADFRSIGQSGNYFRSTNGDGIPGIPGGTEPDPDNPFFGNFGNSWTQVFGFDYLDYSVGLNIEIPLRNRSSAANLAQNTIEQRRLLSRMKNQQQMIMVDVRNAFETITTQKKRLQAARMASRLSEERLTGETKRFQVGLSTNFEVLIYQRNLAEDQIAELRALIDYEVAVTALEKAMYTIIDANDITLAKQQNGP